MGIGTSSHLSFRIDSFPQLAYDERSDRLALTWSDDRNGRYDETTGASIKSDGDNILTFSSDGKHWTTPRAVGAVQDEVFGAVAIRDGVMAVSSYTRHYAMNGVDLDYAYWSSQQRGRRDRLQLHRATTQSSNPQVQFVGTDDEGNEVQGLFIGDYTGVALGSDGVLHPCWTDFRGKPGTTTPNQDSCTQGFQLQNSSAAAANVLPSAAASPSRLLREVRSALMLAWFISRGEPLHEPTHTALREMRLSPDERTPRSSYRDVVEFAVRRNGKRKSTTMLMTTPRGDAATTTRRVASSVRMAALAGIVGPLLFTLAFLLQEAFRREEFSSVAEPVSALEAGPNGWIQQVNFVVFGLMMLAFAVGLNRGVAPTKTGILGPTLLGVASVGLLLAAAFPLREDAAGRTYDPGGHFVAGVTFFLSTSLAMLVLSRRLSMDPRWRGLATYTAVCGVFALIGFVVMGRFAIPDDAALHEYAGLAQRLVILLVTFPCLVALALRLRKTVKD